MLKDKGNHIKVVAYFDFEVVTETHLSCFSSSGMIVYGRLTRNDVKMVVFTLVLEDIECFAVSFK